MAFVLSASASIRRILTQRQSQKLGLHVSAAVRSECRRLFAVTMSCIPGPDRKETDIARPAEFLLDSNGIVRWVNLTENIAVRARPSRSSTR